MKIFEVKSKIGKIIRLTDKIFKHIIYEHIEIENEIEKIKESLTQPDFILYDEIKNTYHYYKHYKSTVVTEKFMHVIAKHLNEEGFVVTAFFTQRIKKVKLIWLRM